MEPGGEVHNYCSALRRGAAAGDPGSLAPGAGKVVAVTRSPAAMWVSGDHGAIGWEHSEAGWRKMYTK